MVNSTSLVSVIMPIYNASRFLNEAITSVLKQSYQNFELLLIDDHSADSSLSIAYNYAKKDSRIQVIPSPSNMGVARIRNLGIQKAHGEYIAFIDSDDMWLPCKLEQQLSLLQKRHAQIAYCSYDFIDENSRAIKRPFLVPATTNYYRMLGRSVISCSTAVIKSSLLKAHPFSTDFYHEDYVLWMELLSLDNVLAVGTDAILAHYRQVQGSRSNCKVSSAKKRWQIYRDALHMGFWSSLSAFTRYAVNGCLKYYF